jgi:hypothetical protein
VLSTTFALVRRIACLADHQKTALVFARINIAGVAGSRGSGSKFIVASITFHFPTFHNKSFFSGNPASPARQGHDKQK